MSSKNKKRPVLPTRPPVLTVEQVLEDISTAFPGDPVFSVLQRPEHDSVQGSADNDVELRYQQGRRYLELNQGLQEVRGHLERQREGLQAAGAQLELTVMEVKGQAF